MHTTSSFDPVALMDVVDQAVGMVARRLPATVDRDDLASAGRVALVKCLIGFAGTIEEARRYAFARVRGAIIDELRALDPLPRSTRARLDLIGMKAAEFEARHGRSPSDTELARACSLSLGQLAEAREAATNDFSLNEDEQADETDVVSEVATKDLSSLVAAALLGLGPVHREVISRYYFRGQKLAEIAEVIGVTIARVHQLRTVAEDKLRADPVIRALFAENV